MKSNFYEKLYSTEDKNKKILMDKMSKILDESINQCIDLRQRQVDENNSKSINNSGKKPKKDIILNQRVYNLFSRHVESNQRQRRFERIRNMINYLEEESEQLYRLIENNNFTEIVG